jgi:hypothetical protein
MKLQYIKNMMAVSLLAFSVTSCGDFLDQPAQDSYNADNYYQTDEECVAGVNYLYNSPWYDFQRGFFKVGEELSGNYYEGSSPYLTFTVNGSDENLVNMSNSLWAEVGHANTVYNNIKSAPSTVSDATRNQCLGECLVWKAMAYFYLVRSFGEVPIIHDTEAELTSGTYNNVTKVKRADVYEYIVMTLEKAMEYLEGVTDGATSGRVDYYSAEALLAKVYLTKAGVSGSLDADDLSMAATYAKDVMDNSGRSLLSDYSDNFRIANNINEESLIAWRWTVGSQWTCQNSLQSDLGMVGFDEFGDNWGQYSGLSVDLQEAFGVKLLENQPSSWINNTDSRLKATMMLPGFTYDYFWQDKTYDNTLNGSGTGFDYLQFIYDSEYNSSSGGVLYSATGSNCVKQLYGDTYDHEQGTGITPAYMSSALATHLLRLSDVYLIYAEAKLGTGGTDRSTTDADAIDAFYQVRHRAISSYEKPTSISFEDIWKERRLEFAMEGDRWYDFVRVSYYAPDFTISELQSQKRNAYWGLDDLYKNYYETGVWTVTSSMAYDTTTSAPDFTQMMKKDPDSGMNYFYLPMSAEDVLYNPNLGSNVDGVHVDVRSTYSY